MQLQCQPEYQFVLSENSLFSVFPGTQKRAVRRAMAKPLYLFGARSPEVVQRRLCSAAISHSKSTVSGVTAWDCP
jgi:hypothetical protein